MELIPTNETDPAVVDFMQSFAENVLGKGVVIAKDTPNFIANRIGTFGLLVTLQEMEKLGLSVGEVDSITGPLIGRPISASFRTLDVVGLDTFIHVVNNVYHQVEGKEKEIFTVPTILKTMVERNWLGAKTNQGFYLKKGKEILQLNLATLEYEPRRKMKTPTIEVAKRQKGIAQKLKTLIYANDQAGSLLWNVFSQTFLYCAERLYEIADSVVAIDQAMKWGFGWEMGPFEAWDAVGVQQSVERMENEGRSVPDWIKAMIGEGFTSFYTEENGTRYYFDQGEYKELKQNKRNPFAIIEKHKGVIKKNTGASLIDIGDDVALLEFHSQNNTIGIDVLQMIQQSIDEVEKIIRDS